MSSLSRDGREIHSLSRPFAQIMKSDL